MRDVQFDYSLLEVNGREGAACGVCKGTSVFRWAWNKNSQDHTNIQYVSYKLFISGLTGHLWVSAPKCSECEPAGRSGPRTPAPCHHAGTHRVCLHVLPHFHTTLFHNEPWHAFYKTNAFYLCCRQVCLFLKRGANQNAADIDEKTPLTIAVEAANADIVTLWVLSSLLYLGLEVAWLLMICHTLTVNMKYFWIVGILPAVDSSPKALIIWKKKWSSGI